VSSPTSPVPAAVAAVVSAPPAVSAAPPASPPRRAAVRDWLADLFPERPARRSTGRRVALGVLAVVVGAGVSLGRIGGPGPFNSIFAEDGDRFLNDALNYGPLHAIFTPFNGYYHIGPRLLAEVASQAPLAWAPAVLSVEAALATSLIALAVYVTSAAHLPSTATRLLVAVPVVAMPVAENAAATATNNVATLQFFALYGAFWMLLWNPRSRLARLVAVGTVAITAGSTLLAAMLVPLALIRLYALRRKVDLALVAVLVAGATTHLTALELGLTARPSFMRPLWDPLWVADAYARWALPHQLFGYRWSGLPIIAGYHHKYLLGALAWLVLAGILAFALYRHHKAVTDRLTGTDSGWGTSAWKLAAVAAVFNVWLLGFQIMSSGRAEERYAITPGLLFLVVMAALLRPSGTRRSGVALGGYAVLLAVVVAVNYRVPDSGRTTGPAWDAELRVATNECVADPSLREVIIHQNPGGAWWVRMACGKLR
jgi:hypothetical protein